MKISNSMIVGFVGGLAAMLVIGLINSVAPGLIVGFWQTLWTAILIGAVVGALIFFGNLLPRDWR